MLAGRVVLTLFFAGLAATACGSSQDSLDLVTADSVEGAAPVDEAGGAEPAPTEPVTDPADSIATDTTDDTDDTAPDGVGDVQMFPDVIDATAEQNGATWTVSATLSSPYDTPERYADAWRVVGPDGTVYGERILTHDHAAEQPFTRSESGIEIPDHVMTVTIEGRDLEFGYGGDTFDLALPR